MSRTPKTDQTRSVPRDPLERTRNSLKSAIARCYRANCSSFMYYGARGIGVCDRWRGRGALARFVEDMGLRPADATLDRIDRDGDEEGSPA